LLFRAAVWAFAPVVVVVALYIDRSPSAIIHLAIALAMGVAVWWARMNRVAG
jgi:hypothetical protein